MATSMLHADKKWGTSSRKSGMTVLGKVIAPKPFNLPSQKLENNGLDPNVEIVPKGTISWGNRPNSSSSSRSPNAWSTNLANSSPRPGSPSEAGRPISSSSSRPSTANTEKVDVLNLNSNSRPSSSSGIFAMGQSLASPNRPRSADTRPGSSQLSRFADASEKLGSATNGGFTLSTGDFPTLGTEKPSEPQRGHSSQGRPVSGPGRDVKPIETLDSSLAGHNMNGRPMSDSGTDLRPKTPNTGEFTMDPRSQVQNTNILKTEDPSNHWYHQSTNPYQSRPNINMNPHVPHGPGPQAPGLQYDTSWRGPPPQAPHEGVWYGPGPRGPIPHGPGPYGPNGAYPVDPFVYYPPPPAQFRAPAPNAESSSRPHMPPHNPYLIPTHIQARPGVHAPPHAAYGPGTYDANYYGPQRTGFYGNPNHRPVRPHNANHHHNTNNNYNNNNQKQVGILSQYNEKSGPSADSGQIQYKVLLKHREPKEEEKKDEIVPAVTLKSEDEMSETGSEKQNEKKKDPLIHKIEELNRKMRNMEMVKEDEASKQQTGKEGILGTPTSGTRGASSSVKAAENVVGKRWSEQTNDDEVDMEKEGNVGTVPEANLAPLDPIDYEVQKLKLKEKAAQRAKELQREEEERIQNQRAKALAKLEELDRRANLQKNPPNSTNDIQPQQEKEQKQDLPKIPIDIIPKEEEPSKISNDTGMQNETNLHQEPQKFANETNLRKEPRRFANDQHFQKEPRKFANDTNLLRRPSKSGTANDKDKQLQQEPLVVAGDNNLQKEPSKIAENKLLRREEPPKFSNITVLQKEPPKSSNDKQLQQEIVDHKNPEISTVPTTVTLSFGTISEVQIISHEVSAPMTGTVQATHLSEVVAVPEPSQPKHHHHPHNNKQTGYKKRHNSGNNNNNNHNIGNISNANVSSEMVIYEKSSDVFAGTEPQNEPHHRKRGNKNPRNKNKPDETVPVLVPVEEKVQKSPSESKGVDNPNSVPVPTESSGRIMHKPHENPNFNNNRGGHYGKGQSSRRPVRNPRHVPEKLHETVMWAPVKQSNKTNHSEESTVNNTGTVNKSEIETQVNNPVKSKRAEMERYVPKPQLERKVDEQTGEVVLPPPEAKTGEDGENNGTSNRSFKRGNGKPHSSWRQRAVPVEPVPVAEEKNTKSEWDEIPVEPVPVQYSKDQEGDKRKNYNSKFYKATGNNYSGVGNGNDVNTSEKLDNREFRPQHWKPKSHHGSNMGSNWQQKVEVSEEGKSVNSTQRGTGEGGLDGSTNIRGGYGSSRYQHRGSGRGRNGNFSRE